MRLALGDDLRCLFLFEAAVLVFLSGLFAVRLLRACPEAWPRVLFVGPLTAFLAPDARFTDLGLLAEEFRKRSCDSSFVTRVTVPAAVPNLRATVFKRVPRALDFSPAAIICPPSKIVL